MFKGKIYLTLILAIFIGLVVVNQKAFASEINDTKDIKEIFEEGSYESIKKIDVENDKPTKANEISKENLRSYNFEDGLYVIDRKDGWLRARDAGFLKSLIIPKGTEGGLEESKYEGFKTSVTSSATASFEIPFIKASIETAYGTSATEGREISLRQVIEASADKNLFVKMQTVYRKYEVVRIRGGVIIDHSVSYKPTSFRPDIIEFSDGEAVNQKSLYRDNDICILGDEGYDTEELIERTIDESETINTIGGYKEHRTGYYLEPTALGIYFSVQTTGMYEIRDKVSPLTASEVRVGTGCEKSIYEVRPSDNKQKELVGRVAETFDTHNWFVDFIGAPVTVKLEAGKKYLLALNESHKTYWRENADIAYNIEFKKATDFIEEGLYEIKNMSSSNTTLYNFGDGRIGMHPSISYSDTNAKFIVDYVEEKGAYTIKNLESFTLMSWTSKQNNKVVLYPAGVHNDQLWRFNHVGNGEYEVINYHNNGKYLNVDTNNTNVSVCERRNNDKQKFTFRRLG